jgi:hypothetical protein
MSEFSDDVFTEPEYDVHTLNNLGPLTPMAGIWEGTRGLDLHPEVDGPLKQAYHERIELQPIDPQTNGPQLFYGLRYAARIVKVGEDKAFHDQVGYWLWEPGTETVILTLSIPRGQTALAIGKAKPDAKTFEVVSKRGSEVNGICSNPFLEFGYRTTDFRMSVSINGDGTWSYDEETILIIHGQAEPFRHTDQNTLKKIADATPNPYSLPGAIGS